MKRALVALAVFWMGGYAWAGAKPNGLVILATDYGADSIYVGEIKGAIYNKFPQARVDSITNSIPPYDIVVGAYTLLESTGMFPSGTTFVCIVDPGVGTPRKPIVLETKDGQRYVGPDNGILSLVAEKYGVAEIRECANQELWRAGDVSHTFHGRDIFGPVAAALAGGAPMDKVGPKLDALTKLDFAPSAIDGATVRGLVDADRRLREHRDEHPRRKSGEGGRKMWGHVGRHHWQDPVHRTIGEHLWRCAAGAAAGQYTERRLRGVCRKYGKPREGDRRRGESQGDREEKRRRAGLEVTPVIAFDKSQMEMTGGTTTFYLRHFFRIRGERFGFGMLRRSRCRSASLWLLRWKFPDERSDQALAPRLL